jgi:dTDP-4-dehydrorhamnose 3,5-epimerase
VTASQQPQPGPANGASPAWPKLDLLKTGIEGCYELRPAIIVDERGFFAKLFHEPLWRDLGLCTHYQEEYWTYSVRGTIRGLHFQTPPMHHHKVVVCLKGWAWDVALDLRQSSPTFGEQAVVTLDAGLGNAMYIPAGVAHGFCVPEEDALMYYKVSTVYSPQHDRGLRWDSAGIEWPISNPIISRRDQCLPALHEFVSPFQ